MSITLNEAGLSALLGGAAVSNLIQKKAEEVVEQAQENITEKIMVRVNFRGQIAANVGYKMEGTTAIIGIRESGERAPESPGTGAALGAMTPGGGPRGNRPARGSGAERKKSREQYLAQKEVKEGGVWLLPAVQAVFS